MRWGYGVGWWGRECRWRHRCASGVRGGTARAATPRAPGLPPAAAAAAALRAPACSFCNPLDPVNHSLPLHSTRLRPLGTASAGGAGRQGVGTHPPTHSLTHSPGCWGGAWRPAAAPPPPRTPCPARSAPPGRSPVPTGEGRSASCLGAVWGAGRQIARGRPAGEGRCGAPIHHNHPTTPRPPTLSA